MFSKPRNAVLACFAFAFVVGWVVLGHYLYTVPVGLDQTAFVAGEILHSVALMFLPGLNNAASGVVALLLLLLAVGGVSFFVVRSAVRKRAARMKGS